MKMGEIARRLNLRCLTPELESAAEVEIVHVHISDVLSEVVSRAHRGSLLVTLKTDLTMIAAAVLKGLSSTLFTGGAMPDHTTIIKAVQEQMPLYATEEPTFTVAAGLALLGIKDHQDA